MAEQLVFNFDEIWKPIPGYEGYEASNQGRIRSIDREVQYGQRIHRLRGRIIKSRINNKGYRQVVLFRHAETVHKLVMLAHMGPRPEGMEVCHGKSGRLDNRLSNLRYDTSIENDRDKDRHGTRAWGERSGAARLTADAVRVIKARLESAVVLATRYGVSANQIQRIWAGGTWGRLDGASNSNKPRKSSRMGARNNR